MYVICFSQLLESWCLYPWQNGGIPFTQNISVSVQGNFNTLMSLAFLYNPSK